MKFDQYLNEGQLNEQFLEQTFLKIKDYGAKLGVKVERTKSIAEMLVDGGKELQKFMAILFHYSTHADLLDTAARKKLESDLKAAYNGVDEREVVAFLLALDKLSLGITSAPRKFVETLIGIKMTSYNTYENQTEQLVSSLLAARTILGNFGDKENEKHINDMIGKYKLS